MAWVDAARGLAITLVVLFHASKRSVSAGSADWWIDVVDVFQTMRMPLFFAAAGIFAAKWVGERTSWPALLRSKVMLLVWVYLVWLLVRYAWFLVMPGGQKMTPYDDLVVPVWWPSGGWFIVALAAMYVIAKAVHRIPRAWVLAGASMVSVVFLAGWVEVGNHAWDGVGRYAAFFLIGVLLRGPILDAAARVGRPVALAVPLAWLAGYALCAAQGLTHAPVVGFVLPLGGVAAGVSVAVLLQRSTALRALGRGTLPIYLAHQLLVISAVVWLSARWSFGEQPVLHQGAPLLLTVLLVVTTYWFGRVAPRIGLGWLFAVPAWLVRLTGGSTPVPAVGLRAAGGGRAGL